MFGTTKILHEDVHDHFVCQKILDFDMLTFDM